MKYISLLVSAVVHVLPSFRLLCAVFTGNHEPTSLNAYLTIYLPSSLTPLTALLALFCSNGQLWNVLLWVYVSHEYIYAIVTQTASARACVCVREREAAGICNLGYILPVYLAFKNCTSVNINVNIIIKSTKADTSVKVRHCKCGALLNRTMLRVVRRRCTNTHCACPCLVYRASFELCVPTVCSPLSLAS